MAIRTFFGSKFDQICFLAQAVVFSGQKLHRTLKISKIPSLDQKLQAFLTILFYQILVRNGNGPNFRSCGGIFQKSSPFFLIWPGLDKVLGKIAYFQL